MDSASAPVSITLDGECDTGCFISVEQSFSFKHLSDFLERLSNLPSRESYLSQSRDVAEFLAIIFQQDDGTGESQPTLEQPRLVNDIHSR